MPTDLDAAVSARKREARAQLQTEINESVSLGYHLARYALVVT